MHPILRHPLVRACLLPGMVLSLHAAEFDVRAYGAAGDGKTLDSPAINRAIAAAHAAGGGTVCVPAGDYLSGSIHLLSNVTLCLEPGSTLEATPDPKAYDPSEPNEFGDKNQYEDFGHRHWHDSLIWGDGVENIGIVGSGLIRGSSTLTGKPVLSRGLARRDHAATPIANKAITLKNCRNVLLRDFSILYGGWFGILAIGTDNFTLDNLKIDTNRDGMDIDCCRNVHVSNCSVNSPFDDGICLKSTYGLGFSRATENVTIANCHVSGYDVGTFLAGTFERKARYRDGGPTGRIKFGTESNGGFKNIAVSNCTFDYCRGLALETVDGGWLEDVSITNLTMRDIGNSAIYLRLGSRDRGPKETTVPGYLRRVSISNVVASNVEKRFSSIISGIPGHLIEDVTLSNIRIVYQGGGTAADAALHPPEDEAGYPEPARNGTMPAYGFFVRHVKGISFHDIDIRTATPDARPPFLFEDVMNAECAGIAASHSPDAPTFILRKVNGLSVRGVPGLPDARRGEFVEDDKL